MGIYNDGLIYDICCYIYVDDECLSVFEVKYNQKMDKEQIRQIKTLYENLSNKNNEEYMFKYHTNCSSTYGDGTYMDWWPIDINYLEKWMMGLQFDYKGELKN